MVMIVRDEARILERCLESADQVCDRAVILDTGSTDGTAELAEACGAVVHHAGWQGFGKARTEAVRIGFEESGADYLLMLDADMTLQVEDRFHVETLTAPAYYLGVEDGGEGYRLPLLLRNNRSWRFVGDTHEYLDYIGPDRLDSLRVIHHCDGSRRPRKLIDDLALLEAAYAREPADPRTLFYLANTLRDLGRPQEALPFYRARALAGGWQAEAALAALQAIRIEAGIFDPVGVPSPA